ncbi:MAG: hypothetical protein AAFR21_03580 [Pseudomonadota bacterium]
MPDPLAILQTIESLASENLIAALIMAVAMMTVVVSLPIPFGSAFSVSMGYLFGVFTGSAVIAGSLTLSTLILTSVGITRNSTWIAKHRDKFERFSTLFDSLFKVVLLRQVSVLPNFFFCVAAKYYEIPKQRVLLGTALGAWPNALVATYLGASLNSLLELNDPGARPSALIGIALSVVALVGLSFASKRIQQTN